MLDKDDVDTGGMTVGHYLPIKVKVAHQTERSQQDW